MKQPKAIGNRRLKRVKGYSGIARYERLTEAGWRPEGESFLARTRIGGRQIAKTFSSLSEAIKWQRGEDEKRDVENPLFRSVVNKWLQWIRREISANRMQESTLELYERKVRVMDALMPIRMSDLDAKFIDKWIAGLVAANLANGYTGRLSYEGELRVLKVILGWYREEMDPAFVIQVVNRHVINSFCRPAKEKARILSLEDRLRLLEDINLHEEPQMYYLGNLMLDIGPRIGETCALRLKDLQISRGTGGEPQIIVNVNRTVQWMRTKAKPQIRNATKNGRTRMVMLPPDGVEKLLTWIDMSGITNPDALLFAAPDGGPLAYAKVQNAFYRSLKRLGLRCSPTHVFRHTFATEHLDQTGDILATQSKLGHTDMRTTQHYARVSVKSQERVQGKYSSRRS